MLVFFRSASSAFIRVQPFFFTQLKNPVDRDQMRARLALNEKEFVDEYYKRYILWYNRVTGAEDRATLESDLSAAAGDGAFG